MSTQKRQKTGGSKSVRWSAAGFTDFGNSAIFGKISATVCCGHSHLSAISSCVWHPRARGVKGNTWTRC